MHAASLDLSDRSFRDSIRYDRALRVSTFALTMTRTSRAIVQTAPRTLELRELPLPEIGPDDALLQVEACGICGSDYEQYEGALPVRLPRHPRPRARRPHRRDRRRGRPPLARRRRATASASRRSSCGVPSARRLTHLCSGAAAWPYGFLSVDDPPGLWGGYASTSTSRPQVNVHKIDESIDPAIATLFNPIGAGFRWAVDMPRLQPGETIVILGPGQRGLGSVIAAKEAGAGRIIVTGLERDAAKLALAREFGADLTLLADRDDLRTAVREATDGRGADVVIDVTAYATQAVTQAIDLARRGGTRRPRRHQGPRQPRPRLLQRPRRHEGADDLSARSASTTRTTRKPSASSNPASTPSSGCTPTPSPSPTPSAPSRCSPASFPAKRPSTSRWCRNGRPP